MRYSRPRTLLTAATAVAAVVAVVGTALWSAQRVTWTGPLFEELTEVPRLDAVRVFPRTTGALAALGAEGSLAAGRPWEAWRMLRDEVHGDRALPGSVLLGARAAAAWGGWTTVRDLLRGQEWLDTEQGGEGRFLLARAEEERGNEEAAADSYRRYLALAAPARRGEALARLAGVLAETGDARGAAEAYAAAAREMPEVEDWLQALQLEQEVAAGVRTPAAPSQGFITARAPARARRALAEAEGWAESDPARALGRLEAEERVLRAQDAFAEAARLRVARAERLIEAGRDAEARETLRPAAADPQVPAATRLAAARLLEERPGRGLADELALAAAYEAAGRPGLAARSLRAAIAAGATDDAETRMRLARLLYDERDFGPARAAYERAAERLTDPERVAEARLYAARSLYRGSSRRSSETIAELKRIVERYPGTAAAGSASFLLGDLSSTLELARSHYRRAAAVPRSPDAREALYRLGDRSLRLDDTAGAIRAWEEYVQRYPTGDETARVAYETGKLHERAGRASRARAMYTAAMLAEPVSYYAMRAGERLGVHPLDAILAEPRPWVGLATEPAAAAVVLRRLDALDALGLREEWDAELAAATRSLEGRSAALIALAEGLRDRGHPVAAINLGWRLRETRGGLWDVRLLRVVFPFLHRDLIEDEARRKGVDPMLLAGLIRQESSFRHDARSWVGATGLGQIMPSTGEWLAPLAGVRNFEPSLLEVPEINVRMAAEYLEDLLHRYDGAHDLALAAYNAGPGRADRWRRTLPRDRDAFREAIPFDETRGYVKLVLRNAAVYERLYGGR